MKKIILHLCADLGSDSRFYQLDNDYEVIMIGKEIGVENYIPPKNVHGIIANPVCTEFSCLNHLNKKKIKPDLSMIKHCERIIEEVNPKWWVIENPARGSMRKHLGKPAYTYQPWNYGSPWTKQTALWGNFNMPEKVHTKWETVEKNEKLYVRPNREKPGLNFQHKSAINHIPEFEFAREHIKCDADIRSMCSQGFAKAFYEANK